MMGAYAQDSYLEQEILSADGIELIRILYRGALDAVDGARACLSQRDIAGRSKAISKAVAILAELSGSVSREQGGEVAVNLIELYDYLQRRLLEANMKQIDEPLAESSRLLGTRLEAWSACRVASPDPAPLPSPACEPEYAVASQGWSL
jgi:flagellar secretion chaperone FliS